MVVKPDEDVEFRSTRRVLLSGIIWPFISYFQMSDDPRTPPWHLTSLWIRQGEYRFIEWYLK